MKFDLLLYLNDRSPTNWCWLLLLLLLVITSDRNHSIVTLLQSLDIETHIFLIFILQRFRFGSRRYSLAFLRLCNQLCCSAGVEENQSGNRGIYESDLLVEDTIRTLPASEALSRLRIPLDGTGSVEIMTAERYDGLAPERLSTNQASERQIFILGVVGVAWFVTSCSSSLLGEEGSGGGVGGEE